MSIQVPTMLLQANALWQAFVVLFDSRKANPTWYVVDVLDVYTSPSVVHAAPPFTVQPA